eukprot:6683016-Karenia_brevis.AAC.1
MPEPGSGCIVGPAGAKSTSSEDTSSLSQCGFPPDAAADCIGHSACDVPSHSGSKAADGDESSAYSKSKPAAGAVSDSQHVDDSSVEVCSDAWTFYIGDDDAEEEGIVEQSYVDGQCSLKGKRRRKRQQKQHSQQSSGPEILELCREIVDRVGTPGMCNADGAVASFVALTKLAVARGQVDPSDANVAYVLGMGG